MTPAPRKTPAKGRKKKSGKGAPHTTRLTVLAVVLAVIAIAGIVLVKYLQTPRGQAALLDRGFRNAAAEVHVNIDSALRGALEPSGLDRRISVQSSATPGQWPSGATQWRINCPPGTDLILINVALTEAAERAGGRVRKSEEREGGRALYMSIGTRLHETHRITLRMAERRAAEPKPPKSGRPRVAIVIDDFGYSRSGVAAKLIALDLPLSISILPGLPHSRRMLDRARAAGRCTLLHLPMEAEHEEKADAVPVTTAMSDREVAALVDRYLDSLPGVAGVNNHQGSRATADPRVMRAVIEVLRRRGLFFLDSLTSSKSVAYNTARELGVPSAKNTLFLDDDTEDTHAVEERLHQLVALARTNGSAIGICHPHRWTFEALERSMEYLQGSGVDLVPVCSLMAGDS